MVTIGYELFRGDYLSQSEAGELLGMSERNFRRYLRRYREEGESGLLDERLIRASHRCAPVDEVLAMCDLYSSRYAGWNVKHFYSFYRREHGGDRSYSWVKNHLQARGLVKKASGRGKHRRKRERAPMEGMLLHQDGSTHEWVPGKMWDLIITLDDATNRHYSMFFVDEEGTSSSLRGMRAVLSSIWACKASGKPNNGASCQKPVNHLNRAKKYCSPWPVPLLFSPLLLLL